MKDLLTRLDKWLVQHRARFHKNLRKGASAAALAKLEKSVGKPLPDAMRQLLAWHDGQGEEYAGYFQAHWLLMSAGQIAEVKEDLDDAGERGWKKIWLPFLDDDNGNFVCLDLSKKEPPVINYSAGAPFAKMAPSLETWLTEFVAAVEAGEYFEEPERGTFQRGKKK